MEKHPDKGEQGLSTADKCYTVATRAARYVGGIIKSRIFEAKTKVTTKSSAMDFVTDTDKEVETYIKSTIRKYFPGHAFIGEESASMQSSFHLADTPTWIVDPVDGTMNFVHGYPNVCVSIALVINKIAEFGIIYNPVLDYFFEARRGNGAKLNGKPIHVSKTTDISNTLLSFEFGTSAQPDKIENSLANLQNILEKVQGIRSTGSAAMNMALVAMGACDAYFEFGIHIWDIMAGELLVQEAGGVVMDPSGGDFDPLSRKILCASSMKVARSLVKELIQLNIPRDGMVLEHSKGSQGSKGSQDTKARSPPTRRRSSSRGRSSSHSRSRAHSTVGD